MATTAPQETTKPRVGIISMGDMGSGLARLLVAHDYQVYTNCTGRSQDTISRAEAAGVNLLATDKDLISQCDLILSVVPPRDAIQTAKRILTALSSSSPDTSTARSKPLYFADMNAISPATCRTIASLFSSSSSSSSDNKNIPDSVIRFIDGSILGGPPTPPPSSSSQEEVRDSTQATNWTRPLLPTSGPYSISDLDPKEPNPSNTNTNNQTLSKILNTKHISQKIGSASGLKMCFASLSKGYAAIAVQTVTTAHRLGVLDHLKDSLLELTGPESLQRMERAVVGMAPKAYRWVREMEEISATHAVDGGFLLRPDEEDDDKDEEEGDGKERGKGENIFDGAAGIFKFVAEGTVLGGEKVPFLEAGEASGTGDSGSNSNKRVRGTTSEDVARCMAEGLEEREKKRRKEQEH